MTNTLTTNVKDTINQINQSSVYRVKVRSSLTCESLIGVCQKCYDKIFELKELNKTIKFFDLLDLDISDYKNISLVCKSADAILMKKK